ncbi:hypothetical protein C0J52_17204 [Blattella germanica]|nr:hypothetical protein C0J52_17204 [Blattella germanica]
MLKNMGGSQSKQRKREEEKIMQQLARDKQHNAYIAVQRKLLLDYEQLKHKKEEEKHLHQLQEARHQCQLEEQNHHKQLQIQNQRHHQKLMEEKKNIEELKKQCEEIEREFQKFLLQQKQSLKKNEKCYEKSVPPVLETVKQQTYEIQRNAEEKPLHQKKNISEQSLFKENSLQPLVANAYVTKPKEKGVIHQHEENLKEKLCESQTSVDKYYQKKNTGNRKNRKEDHKFKRNTLKTQSLENLSREDKEERKLQFNSEEKLHESQTSVDKYYQKKNTGTRKKDHKFKTNTLKTQSLEDLCREHKFYLAPVTRYMWHAVLRDTMASKWMPMPKNKPYIKVEIPKDSDEFASINSAFRSSQKTFKIVQVDRIQNPYLLGCYMLKRLELKNTFNLVTEKMLFRGTKQRYVHSICEDNFNWRLQEGVNSRNKFGKGVSFNTSAYNATFYSDKDSMRKMMFLARVLVSKETQHDPDMIVPPKLLEKWPSNSNQNNVLRFDTTRAHGGKIWVKYSDNDFYPQYLIHYTEEWPDEL